MYVYSLVARHTGLTPAAPLLREIAKVEPVTVAELNSFFTTVVSEVKLITLMFSFYYEWCGFDYEFGV